METTRVAGTVVELEGVGKRYGRSRPVLSGVDLRLEPGSVTAVAGRNGSGKTTLLRMIAGVTPPTAGRVRGRPGVVGYVPERFPPHLRFTPTEYLAHMGGISGLRRKEVRARTAALAERLGFEALLGRRMLNLSKGNCQKVALAQALLRPPGLLVLDEPWTGLDERAHAELFLILAELRAAGAVVVLCDQRSEVVRAAGDRILTITGGHVREGLAEEVLALPAIEGAAAALAEPPALPSALGAGAAPPETDSAPAGPTGPGVLEPGVATASASAASSARPATGSGTVVTGVRVELAWADRAASGGPAVTAQVLRQLEEVVPPGTWAGLAMGRGALSFRVSEHVVDALLRRALEIGLSVRRVEPETAPAPGPVLLGPDGPGLAPNGPGMAPKDPGAGPDGAEAAP